MALIIMDLKRQAAERALEFVRDGMTLGLGTGSTMAHFIEMLGERVRLGELKNLRAVPTSEQTVQRASEAGVALVSLMEAGGGRIPELDLAVDGADEVDPDLNLIKGLGRALLREKIVEIHAREFVVVVDDSKLVPRLGTRGPVPVEIVPFNADVQVSWLALQGCQSELWLEPDGRPVVTDNGNYLARCWFSGGIPDCRDLAARLSTRPGIVEHGLFLDMATVVLAAGQDGIRTLRR